MGRVGDVLVMFFLECTFDVFRVNLNPGCVISPRFRRAS